MRNWKYCCSPDKVYIPCSVWLNKTEEVSHPSSPFLHQHIRYQWAGTKLKICQLRSNFTTVFLFMPLTSLCTPIPILHWLRSIFLCLALTFPPTKNCSSLPFAQHFLFTKKKKTKNPAFSSPSTEQNPTPHILSSPRSPTCWDDFEIWFCAPISLCVFLASRSAQVQYREKCVMYYTVSFRKILDRTDSSRTTAPSPHTYVRHLLVQDLSFVSHLTTEQNMFNSNSNNRNSNNSNSNNDKVYIPC